MTDQELGKALTEARVARGLSLPDVERDTRISIKYLKALEAGEFGELPAPVYARAFMRTYAQYLRLNASAMVQQLPGARPEPELPPLPDVGREATSAPLSASWMVAGVVVVLLIAVGLVLFWSRGGGEEAQTVVPPPVETPSGQGAEAFTPTDAAPPTVVVEAGVVPDLVEEHVFLALGALRAADLTYVVIEVENDDIGSQFVFAQNPSPQTAADGSTVVTLLVSR